MRRIAYLKWERNPDNWDECLDLCSKYTPLVEPCANEAVYLDLSGCGDTFAILQRIGYFALHSQQGSLRTGLATSRLLARIAAGQDLASCSTSTYQVTSYPGIRIIEVLPGQEKDFLSVMPLTSLDSISSKVIKKLARLGLFTVADLNQLSPEKLGQLTGENPYLLVQKLNGIDPSPVTGLYPPDRLTYPINLEEGPADLIRIEKMLRNAARELERLLEERHAGCRYIKLEIRLIEHSVLKERGLSGLCWRSSHLFNVLQGLIEKEYLSPNVTGLLITLQEFATLTYEQPDLFIQRVFYEKKQREGRVEEALRNLQNRFPGSLRRGMEVERREQILALWDPWRGFRP